MENKLTFRKTVRPEDVQTVRQLLNSSHFFEMVYDEIDCATAEIEAAVNGEKGAETFMFAELDGKTVGFCCYSREDCCDSLCYMSWLAVDNSLRGHGLGRKLMDAALADIWNSGAQKTILQTSGRPQYLPTRKFYDAYGFKCEGEISDYYTPGESTVFYSIYNPNWKIGQKMK